MMDNFKSSSDQQIAPTTQTDSPLKRRRKTKKVCWFCRWGGLHIDYKNVDLLKRRCLKNNKIIIHKVTGNCLKHQHQIATAVKRARIVALLPFVGD